MSQSNSFSWRKIVGKCGSIWGSPLWVAAWESERWVQGGWGWVGVGRGRGNCCWVSHEPPSQREAVRHFPDTNYHGSPGGKLWWRWAISRLSLSLQTGHSTQSSLDLWQFNFLKETKMRGWGGGPAGKELAVEAWGTEFRSPNTHTISRGGGFYLWPSIGEADTGRSLELLGWPA